MGRVRDRPASPLRPPRVTAARALACALAAIAATILAAPAQALPPGVFVDPNSPAGKEYALYTGQARGSGSGRPSGQLFGAGIVPPGTRGATGTRTRSRGAPGHRRRRIRTRGSTIVRPRSLAPVGGSPWIGGDWQPWVLIALLLPVIAAVLATWLARRQAEAGSAASPRIDGSRGSSAAARR
jgi:hypothetical protein